MQGSPSHKPWAVPHYAGHGHKAIGVLLEYLFKASVRHLRIFLSNVGLFPATGHHCSGEPEEKEQTQDGRNTGLFRETSFMPVWRTFLCKLSRRPLKKERGHPSAAPSYQPRSTAYLAKVSGLSASKAVFQTRVA